MIAPDKKLIGKSLQQARKAAGFKSAKAFADHLGIPVSKYTEYEQGRHGFTYEQAWIFADALGCTIDEIGGRKTPEHHSPDPHQEILNDCYQQMNARGRERLAEEAAVMLGSGMFERESME